MVQGQDLYPDNVWSIRNADNSNGRGILYTNVSGEHCHGIYDISDPVRYVRLPQGNDLMSFGTDINNLTEYTFAGPRPYYANEVGFYFPTGNFPTSDIVDSTRRARDVTQQVEVCAGQINSLWAAEFSDSHEPGEEFFQFRYELNRPLRLRAYIVDAANNDAPIRLPDSGDYYGFDGDHGLVTISVPERQIGQAYKLILQIDDDRSTAVENQTPLKEGIRVIGIDSRGLRFMVAHRDGNSGDRIWIDRINRGDTPSRNRGRFKTNYDVMTSSFGGRIKRYTIHFGRDDLYTYEAVQINAQRGTDNTNPWVRQLNGPQIRFTWRNVGSASRSDVSYGFDWRIELPPGWDKNQVTNRQIRFYSGGESAGAIEADDDDARDDIDEFLSGTHNRGVGTFSFGWQHADNDWEMGVGFDFAGRRYRIKLVDHINHGRSPRPGAGTNPTGGVYNTIHPHGRSANIVGNVDHSENSGTHGGHHAGRILWSTSGLR